MRLVTCFLLLLFATARAEQCLVIGDSLTKEYEVEFAALFPTNPAALQARNWIEILHQHRTDWFDTGVFDTWADIRATGHAHNWAVPGATTGELKSLLTNFLNQILWVNSLKNHIRYDVERVVIFAGGNDADSYYANLYNGLVVDGDQPWAGQAPRRVSVGINAGNPTRFTHHPRTLITERL